MPDIKCVVCGEPWDAWGLNHGDVAAWELDLFRAGAGCPCCEGEPPEDGPWQPQSIADIENGDGDPAERLAALEDAGDIEWAEPEPEVAYACSECGARSIWNSERPYDGDKKSTDPLWLSWECYPKPSCKQCEEDS